MHGRTFFLSISRSPTHLHIPSPSPATLLYHSTPNPQKNTHTPHLPEPHLPPVTPQAIGGALWHGIKGFRNSPLGERRIGALTAIKARAPVLGGNFGVWGGLFSSFDCAVKGIRKKEDPYNASMSFTLAPTPISNVPVQVFPRAARVIVAGFYEMEMRRQDESLENTREKNR